jgi:hypothetical protein
MVLVQIPILPATNNRFFPIGVIGPCSIRVLGVQYHQTGGGGGGGGNTAHLCSILSDQLVFPYSPARHFTFIVNAEATVSLDQGHEEYHLKNVPLNGGIQIYLIDRATGTTPANFGYALLSLSIEKLNETIE